MNLKKLMQESIDENSNASKGVAVRPFVKAFNTSEKNNPIQMSEIEKEELGKKLMEAITNNNFIDVKNSIEKGADVNYIDDTGASPLLLATVTPDSLDVFKYLIEKGADVNFEIETNNLLLYATYMNDFEKVKVLVENNVNINHKERSGKTALIKAMFNGNLELAQYLIDNGADINIRGHICYNKTYKFNR